MIFTVLIGPKTRDMLWGLLKSPVAIWRYPVDLSVFSSHCNSVSLARLEAINRAVADLQSLEFPLSVIVNMTGDIVAEKFLHPVPAQAVLQHSYRKKTRIRIYLCDFDRDSLEQLGKEYESLFEILSQSVAYKGLIPKSSRLAFYRRLVPNFDKKIKSERRGGDRHGKNWKSIQESKNANIVTGRVISKVAQRLIPRAITYAVVNRDLPEIRNRLLVEKNSRRRKNKSTEIKIDASKPSVVFDPDKFIQNLSLYSENQKSHYRREFERCFRFLEGRTFKDNGIAVPVRISGPFTLSSHIEISKTLLEIRERLEAKIKADVPNGCLDEMNEILDVIIWDRAYGKVVRGDNRFHADLHLGVVKLFQAIIHQLEGVYQRTQGNINPDHVRLERLYQAVDKMADDSKYVLLFECAELLHCINRCKKATSA